MKVSVITATYNSELTIEDTIQSLNQQNYSDIEYIVIDGASNDSTLKIINNYRLNIATLISEKDKGIYDALNKGIAVATGDVIGFLHSDDLFANKNVISQIASEFTDKAVDAFEIDTSEMNADKVFALLVEKIDSKLNL